MSKVDDIGIKWAANKKSLLIKNHLRLGLKASGEFQRKLDVNYKNKVSAIEIVGTAPKHAEYMQNGRRANQDQSKEAIRKWAGWAGSTFLKDWVQDKGLSINPFAVAYKIAKDGIKVPNKHNEGGLVTDVINTKSINELVQSLGQAYLTETTSQIRNIFKDK